MSQGCKGTKKKIIQINFLYRYKVGVNWYFEQSHVACREKTTSKMMIGTSNLRVNARTK